MTKIPPCAVAKTSKIALLFFCIIFPLIGCASSRQSGLSANDCLNEITACTATAGIGIDSFRVLNITPDFVEIELVGSYDGSIGQLWLGVIAKTTDGIVRSSGYPPVMIPSGKQFHILVRALRPTGLGPQKTDLLLVMVYPGGKDIVLRRIFRWPNAWPEKTASVPAGTDEYPDLSTAYPWQIFYQNLEEEAFGCGKLSFYEIDIVFEGDSF